MTISDSNPGRYLLVASLAQPSVVAILERIPSLESGAWLFHMRLLSLTRVPIEDLVLRTRTALTRGKLDNDTQVLVDATDAGSLSIRMSRQLGGAVFRLIAGPVADQDKRYEDVHCVTDVDVADAVGLVSGRRLSISSAIPRVIVERLTNQAAERRFALPERPIALALWHAHRFGGCEFVTRRPTEAEQVAQFTRTIDEQWNRDLELRKREERSEREAFGTD
jgi:hypothetical protein